MNSLKKKVQEKIKNVEKYKPWYNTIVIINTQVTAKKSVQSKVEFATRFEYAKLNFNCKIFQN